MFELLKDIENGSLHSTDFYNPDWKVDESLSDIEQRRQSRSQLDRWQKHQNILRLIHGEKLVAGDFNQETSVFTNLRLTKRGEEFIKLGSLTYNDIVVSKSWKEWLLKPVVVEVFKKFVPWAITILLLLILGLALSKCHAHSDEESKPQMQTVKA